MRRVYRICSLDGTLVAEHKRVESPPEPGRSKPRKALFWRRADGSWEDGLGGLAAADLPLYRTERLRDLEVGRTVLVGEGEKTTEAIERLGFPAVGVTCPSLLDPLHEDVVAPLLPFDAVVWPDHLDGTPCMARLVARLRHVGGSARRLVWPDAREKGDDAADFLARGGTPAQLRALVDAAQPWVPTVEECGEQRKPRPVGVPTWRPDGTRIGRAREQIEAVVASRLGPPKRADRRSLWWPCPFHGERTPSFKVDLAEPFWKCHGCGAGGDVFDFVERFDGLPFKDALRELAPVGMRTVDVWSL